MGTKPAKVGRLVPCLLNQGSDPGNKPGIPVNSRIRLFLAVFAKRSSLRGWTKVAKVGPPWARVKFAKVRPTPYVYYPRVEEMDTVLYAHLTSKYEIHFIVRPNPSPLDPSSATRKNVCLASNA